MPRQRGVRPERPPSLGRSAFLARRRGCVRPGARHRRHHPGSRAGEWAMEVYGRRPPRPAPWKSPWGISTPPTAPTAPTAAGGFLVGGTGPGRDVSSALPHVRRGESVFEGLRTPPRIFSTPPEWLQALVSLRLGVPGRSARLLHTSCIHLVNTPPLETPRRTGRQALTSRPFDRSKKNPPGVDSPKGEQAGVSYYAASPLKPETRRFRGPRGGHST